MSLITIPTRSSTDLVASADVNDLMSNCTYIDGRIDDIIDEVYPVGTTYTQYPAANSNTLTTAFPESEEPTTLFGGTWSETWGEEGSECDFANEGIFFKTTGDTLSQTDGENNARTNGLQTDAMQGHNHLMFAYKHVNSNYNNEVTSGVGNTYGTFGQVLYPTDDGTNGTPRTGKETRGRNRFIKIWKRTA